MRRLLWSAVTLSAAAALAAGVIPATASTSARPGWHVVYRHRFDAHSVSEFAAITAAGPAQMWAVGGFGVAGPGSAGAVLWKNHSWHVTPVPHAGAIGFFMVASADSASDAWAATANGYVLRWGGSHWRIVRHLQEPLGGPPGALPTGILAISPRDVWVFYETWRDSRGLHGGTQHDLNGTWKQVTGPGRTIVAASEATPSQLWAVGASGVLHFGRRGWQPVTAPALAGLTFGSILAQRHGPVWALGWRSGGTGAAVLADLSGGHWFARPLPPGIHQFPEFGGTALASDGHGGVWIAAPAFFPHPGHLLHFLHGTWYLVSLGATFAARSIVAVPGSAALCAAGFVPDSHSTGATALVWSTARSC